MNRLDRALVRGCLVFSILGLISFPAAPAFAGTEVHPTIDRALDRLYNFDFYGAQAILDGHIESNPEDPLGYVFRGGAYLFEELDRLKILESEFFKDDEKIGDTKNLDPDLIIKRRLMAALDRAAELAQVRLAEDPDDTEALFALCLRQGLLTDYIGLVEKRRLKSLSSAREAERFSQRLLALDPTYYDAHLSSGVNEYLLGSVPFFIRWFIKIDGIEGSKKRALEKLELVADKGSYLGPFARILMSIISLREKQPGRAVALLARLQSEYPENHLIRKELVKISEKLESGELVPSE